MKFFSLFIILLFYSVFSIFSQNSIGTIKITPRDSVGSTYILKVSAANISLSGYQYKMLRAIIYVYKNESIKNNAIVYKDINTSKKMVSINELDFTIDHSILQSIYGLGRQKLKVMFYIANYSTPSPTRLADTYKSEWIEIDITENIDSQTRQFDIKNEEYKQTKAKNNRDYKDLLEIEVNYGITVHLLEFDYGKAVMNQSSWEFLGPKDEDFIDKAVNEFVGSWKRLTPQFVKATGLKRISFVKNVKYSGAMVEQNKTEARDVGGMFDVVDMLILVDVTTVNHDMFGLMHVLYHEYFHIIENVLYAKYYFKNEDWVALNPKDFQYQRDVPGLKLTFSISEEHPIPGFITGYSAIDPWQDRADLFAYIGDEELSTRLSTYIKNDLYLRMKTEFIKKRIKAIEND